MAKIREEGSELRIECASQEEPPPVLIVKYPSEKRIDRFNRERIKLGRHAKVLILHDKDIEFINEILVDCANCEIANGEGSWEQLTPQHENWKDKIPVSWKRSAAMYFLIGEGGEDVSGN